MGSDYYFKNIEKELDKQRKLALKIFEIYKKFEKEANEIRHLPINLEKRVRHLEEHVYKLKDSQSHQG